MKNQKFYVLQVEPTEDEDGEELGSYAFGLIDKANLRPAWYDGVGIQPGPLPVRLVVDDIGGWGSVFDAMTRDKRTRGRTQFISLLT